MHGQITTASLLPLHPLNLRVFVKTLNSTSAAWQPQKSPIPSPGIKGHS
jgi:hypothetical protein